MLSIDVSFGAPIANILLRRFCLVRIVRLPLRRRHVFERGWRFVRAGTPHRQERRSGADEERRVSGSHWFRRIRMLVQALLCSSRFPDARWRFPVSNFLYAIRRCIEGSNSLFGEEAQRLACRSGSRSASLTKHSYTCFPAPSARPHVRERTMDWPERA